MYTGFFHHEAWLLQPPRQTPPPRRKNSKSVKLPQQNGAACVKNFTDNGFADKACGVPI